MQDPLLGEPLSVNSAQLNSFMFIPALSPTFVSIPTHISWISVCVNQKTQVVCSLKVEWTSLLGNCCNLSLFWDEEQRGVIRLGLEESQHCLTGQLP